MRITFGALLQGSESRVDRRIPSPLFVSDDWREVHVVIGDKARFASSWVFADDYPLVGSVQNVVLEDVACRVELDQELTRARICSVVLIEGVVHERAVERAPSVGTVSANRKAGDTASVNQIVSDDALTGDVADMFGRDFEP